jgi:hypothetical protein
MTNTFNTVHIATDDASNIGEAEDHAGMDQPSKGLPIKSRVIPVGSVDDLFKALQKLRDEKYEVDFLDFHTHGYAGSFFLGSRTFNYTDIATFYNRGFDSIFRAGATISFMSCAIADVRLDNSNEDGELFIAEFARTFLRLRGGRVIGRNQPWYYRQGFLWRSPDFKNSGTEISAEIGANDAEATLKGNYRLDVKRLTLEIAVLKKICQAALLPMDQRNNSSGALPTSTGSKMDELVGSYITFRDNQQAIKSINNQRILGRAVTELDRAAGKLKGWGQLYLRLHDAAQIIDDQAAAINATGIPLAKLAPALLDAMRSTPVK